MALINCPNCNNLVSDKAVKCPKCGIDLNAVEGAPEKKAIPQVENIEPVSQIESDGAAAIHVEKDHTLRNVLTGIAVLLALLAISGGVWLYYTNGKEISSSSNLDTAKILEEVDSDMAAKSYEDELEKQNAEKRLEEFKNFKSNDLAAFMLHGKVKKVTSYSGQCFTRCEFDELGVLTKYESGDNHNSYESRISRVENELIIIHAEESGNREVYKVFDNKLVELNFETGCYVYSDFDSNNWPKTRTCQELDGEYIGKFEYSDIDEYGNWTTLKMDGHIMESREIEYYPIQ